MLSVNRYFLGLLFGSTISLTADACRDLAVIRLAKQHLQGAPQGRCVSW
jgi:hypothetical protein